MEGIIMGASAVSYKAKVTPVGKPQQPAQPQQQNGLAPTQKTTNGG